MGSLKSVVLLGVAVAFLNLTYPSFGAEKPPATSELEVALAKDRDRTVDDLLEARRKLVEKLTTLVDPVNDKKYTYEQRAAAAYLLGQMRAPEAVGVLLAAVREDKKMRVFGMNRFDNPFVVALVEIGRPAIPDLLRTVQESDDRPFSKHCLLLLEDPIGGKRRLLETLDKLKARNQDAKVIARVEAAIEYVRENLKEDEEPLY